MTSSVFPAPMFLQLASSLSMVESSSWSNSLRGTLFKHSTTASLTSSFGTSRQLKRAVSLLASLRAYDTSS